MLTKTSEQRLAAGELVPADADVLPGQRLFQAALALQQADQGGGFLVADAQLGFGLGGQGGEQAEAQAKAEQAAAGEGETGHGGPRGGVSRPG